MYVRINPLSVVRVGRKFSRLSTFLLIMLLSLTFLFIVTLISPDDTTKISPENDIMYRRENGSDRNDTTAHDFPISDFKSLLKYLGSNSLKKKAQQKEDIVKRIRMRELSTWTINQSVLVQDYLDIKDGQSFILQPGLTNTLEEFPSFCGPDVKVLIMVATSPGNALPRTAIRDTWGSREALWEKGGRLIFFVGRSDNTTIEELVAEESAKYEDIVEEDFHDSYHNLTLKSIAMLKWVNLTCSKNNMTDMFPNYILKTDDDIFINFDRLVRVTQELPNAQMIGRLTCGAMPIGDSGSKLYMPKYLYPGKVYPGYLSGTAYVLKSTIIPALLQNTRTVPIIHLEDIYVTGLLARHSKIYPQDSPFFTYNRLEPKDDCAFRFMVNSHQMTPSEMRLIYANLKKGLQVPCNVKKGKWLRRIPRINKRLRTLCLYQ